MLDNELQTLIDKAEHLTRFEIWYLQNETLSQKVFLHVMLTLARIKFRLSEIRGAYLSWKIKRLRAKNARRTP